MKKRILPLILAILMAVSFLAACTGNGGTPAPATNGDDATTTDNGEESTTPPDLGDDVTVFTMWSFVETHLEYFYRAADLWNAANPGRQVYIAGEHVPWGQIWENLQMALTIGEGAPDIIDIEIGQAEMYLNVPEGHVPLLPQNDALAPYLPYLVMSRVDPYTAHGNIYGVCYHIGAVMMFYNQALFDEAGLDWREIVTWDDLIEMGHLMMERTGAYMLGLDSNLFGFHPLVAQQHAQYVVDGELRLDTPETVRALQLMQYMIYVHGIARVMAGYALDAEEHYASFNNGDTAAIWAPAWFLERFPRVMPDLQGNLSVGPLPVFEAGNNRSSSAGGTMTAVTNQVDPANADLALDFVAFAKGNYEAAMMQWTLLGFDPIRWDIFDDPGMLAPSPAVDFFGVEFAEMFFDLLFDIQAETGAIDEMQPNSFHVREHIIQHVMPNVVRDNQQSAAEALAEAQAILEQELN